MDIKDAKPHNPIFFKTDYDKKLKAVCADIRKGMPIKNAFAHQGVLGNTYNRWVREARQDWENGFEDTPLLNFMIGAAKVYEEAHMDLLGVAFDLAKEGDSKMVMFLLKSVYGHNPNKKKEVEVTTSDDTVFNINIIPSEQKKEG